MNDLAKLIISLERKEEVPTPLERLIAAWDQIEEDINWLADDWLAELRPGQGVNLQVRAENIIEMRAAVDAAKKATK